MDGQYLTGSGSKIPMPKSKKTEAESKTKPTLTVCCVERTNLVCSSEQEESSTMIKPPGSAKPPAGMLASKARSVPNINKASSVPNINKASGGSNSISRCKTILNKVTPTAGSKMKPPTVAGTKRTLTEDNTEVSSAKQAKQAPKAGFPYKSKHWELKLRLVECETWVTEWRDKCSEIEILLKDRQEEHDNMKEQWEAMLEECSNYKDIKHKVETDIDSVTTQLKNKTSEHEKLVTDSKHFLDTISILEEAKKQLTSQVQILQDDLANRRQEVLTKDSTISQLRINVQDLDFNVRRLNNQIEDLNSNVAKLKQENDELQKMVRDRDSEVFTLKDKLERAERDVKSKATTISDLSDELNRTQSKVNKLNSELNVSSQNEIDLKGRLDSANETIAVKSKNEINLNALTEMLKEKLCQSEKLRRYLHNSVQDLKGNIRVFCRVRPPIQSEKENASPVCILTFPDEGSLEISKADPFTNNPNAPNVGRPKFTKHEFSFDRVFHPNATQEDVFSELSQLVQSALDGYNVCVFAYGQTGSGKTYTMEGPNTAESRGMIPRTVEHVFSSLKELEMIGWQYTVEVCFIEIYNEVIRDLLINDKDSPALKIMQVDSKTNDVVIPGLTIMEVKSYDELDRLYVLAHQNRAVAATSCNERSSRSHSVTKIRVTGTHKEKKETCYGSLNLVDLAGSERLSEPMSDPRFREMKSINKSLSELGNVILGLLQKQEHIPYRNSKLTHLLQPALGGSSKTLMLVNVSPLENCLQETLCSLRFAQKVNQVKIGASKKRVAYDTNNKV